MFRFFQKMKPKVKSQNHEKQKEKTEIQVDGVSIEDFQHFSESPKIELEHKKVLKMALWLSKDFKDNKSNIMDIIELLKPDAHELRILRLQYLYNRKKELMKQMHELKVKIQSQKDCEALKQQYRDVYRLVKEHVEQYITTLERYCEAFKNEEDKVKSYNTYQPLFKYLDHIYENRRSSAVHIANKDKKVWLPQGT